MGRSFFQQVSSSELLARSSIATPFACWAASLSWLVSLTTKATPRMKSSLGTLPSVGSPPCRQPIFGRRFWRGRDVFSACITHGPCNSSNAMKSIVLGQESFTHHSRLGDNKSGRREDCQIGRE